MCSPIPQGDWKLSFKPDVKPPKSLFDQFWEFLGKFIKAVFPIILLVIAIIIGFLLGGGEIGMLFSRDSYPIEDIFQDPNNKDSMQGAGVLSIPKKKKKSQKSRTIIVAVVNSPDEAQDIFDELKNMRLNPSLQSQGSQYKVLIKDLVSIWRARHVLNALQENGFTQVRFAGSG